MSTPFDQALNQLSPLGQALNQLAAITTTTPGASTAIDLCNILRKPEATASDDYGAAGGGEYVPVNGAPVSCEWAPLSTGKEAGVERLVAGQTKAVTFYKVLVPGATDVKAKDRLVILATDTEPERAFEVKDVVRLGRGGRLQVNCTEE